MFEGLIIVLSFLGGSSYLDLPEVHWLADQLVVLGQFLSRRQLDENLAELTPTGAAGDYTSRIKQTSRCPLLILFALQEILRETAVTFTEEHPLCMHDIISHS